MARFLRWLLGLDSVDAILQYGLEAHTLRKRVRDLELDVVQLDNAFDRLRGTVTGALRRREPVEEDVDVDESDEDDDVDQAVLDMINKARHGR